MGECLLSLNAWGTKQRWDTIAFFDTTGVEKSKYISSNDKELKLQDTRPSSILSLEDNRPRLPVLSFLEFSIGKS